MGLFNGPHRSVMDPITTTINDANASTSPPLASNYYADLWSSKGMEITRISVFSLIILAAFCGNLLLIVVTATTKRLRTHTNYFLLNMAISDLLVSVICMPVELVRWFKPYVIESTLACKGVIFLQGVAVSASVLTLVAIAVDRYLAIICPFDKKLSRRSILILIGVIWVVSISVMSPILYVSKVINIEVNNTTQPDCAEHGWRKPEHAAYFTYFLLCAEYFLPLIVIYFIYMRLFLYLWHHKTPGYEELSIDIRKKLCKKQDHRKRVLRMLICVVVVFALCHLPQNVMSMLFYVGGDDFEAPPYMMIIAFCSEICMYINSALNPIIYAFLHRKYQQQLIALFSCCPFLRTSPKGTNSKSAKTLRVTMHSQVNGSSRRSRGNDTSSSCDVASSCSLFGAGADNDNQLKYDGEYQKKDDHQSVEALSHL